MAIDPDAPIPIYYQLKTLLLEEILEGRYPPGERLPTEHELCGRFGISRTPVTRALSELAEEGVILRQRRRGTFVNPHWLQRHPRRAELRVVVPEGPWEELIREAAPPEVGINLASVPLADLHQVLIRAVAEGRAPDLAILDSVWVAEFVSSGFLRPLDELGWWGDGERADFLPPFVDADRSRGLRHVVPAEADVAGLWYRVEDLARLGLDPPRTWEELLASCRAADAWPFPFVMPGGSRAGETATYCLVALLASNGSSVLSEEGITLDSALTVEALRLLRTLIDEELMPQEVVAYEWDRPIRMLAEGRALFSLGGSYEARTLAEQTGLTLRRVGETFGFIPVPAGPQGAPASLAGGMVYGIFRQAARPELAVRVLKHLLTPSVLGSMSLSTGQIPPRRSAVGLVEEDLPFVAVTAAWLEHALLRPATPSYARVSAQLQSMLEAVLTGRLEPEAAAGRAAELIGAITGLPVLHPR